MDASLKYLKLYEENSGNDDGTGRLIIVTEDRYSRVLTYDAATNTLQTVSNNDVSDLTGRPVGTACSVISIEIPELLVYTFAMVY